MRDSQDLFEREVPPESFVKQVKQALEHLYDIDYLERHPLARDEGLGDDPSAPLGGQRLCWELSAAIESLNPGAGTPFAAPPARVYNLLSLRYVECRTVQQAAQELNLSARQAHRDLRRGEESVTAILWIRCAAPAPQEPSARRLSAFEAEMAQLQARPRPADICELLGRAQRAIQPLAAQRGIWFQVEIPDGSVMLSLDPVIAEQVLVNTLSYAVEQAYPDTLHMTLAVEEGQPVLVLRYTLESEEASAPTIDLVVLQLANRVGWTVEQWDQPGGARTVTVRMLTRGPTILVVDDNEGLVSLLERCLRDQACRVVSAANGREGLELAQKLVPDAIILDVMMPEMHGWEFLQRLRAQPQMADIPVIICSVINNPGLSYSLGASMFLRKPVSRKDVLDALRQIGTI